MTEDDNKEREDIDRYWSDIRDMIFWLKNHGGTSIRVGDVAVTFGPPDPGKTHIEERQPTPIDKRKNPLGHPYGVSDDILLRST